MIILVVEDESAIHKLLQLTLRSLAVDIVFAYTVSDALQALEKITPDLIIVDIHLPIHSGWELLEIIRSKPRLDHLPVVILTAHATLVNQQKAHAMGVQHVLIKPVLPDVLRQTLTKTLNP
ncbi:MAG: response regulator [Chloroflexi bacterium]|nr:MAG: response regulator [Chloroflexota bacterium]